MTEETPRKKKRSRGRRRRGKPQSRRSHHRSQAHADAVADGHDQPPKRKLPDHPLLPTADPEQVTSQGDFDALLDRLREAGAFGYDTEFIGELSYYPRICLIQVATTDHVALIDPFEDIDLLPFWKLLADPDIAKIVHAGQQDLEPVVRHLDRAPANIFDTQIAAGFVGLGFPTSLTNLVSLVLDIELGKSMTFTHWDQRPISALHQRYAADDVRFLPILHHELSQRLDAADHADWARQECEAICDPAQYVFDADQRWQRVRGSRSLKPRQIAILRELVAVRDTAAREHDVPPRTMLRDEVLVTLAKNPQKDIEDLAAVRGLPRPFEHAYGAQIIDATSRGRALPDDQVPRPVDKKESAAQKLRTDALWSLINTYCYGRGIDPALVGSRHGAGAWLRRLSKASPRGDDGRPTRFDEGWRQELLGTVLPELLTGDAMMHFTWIDDRLRAETARRDG